MVVTSDNPRTGRRHRRPKRARTSQERSTRQGVSDQQDGRRRAGPAFPCRPPCGGTGARAWWTLGSPVSRISGHAITMGNKMGNLCRRRPIDGV